MGRKGDPRTPGSGRKPTWTSPEAMQEAIDAYFEKCKGTYLRDKETGELLLDKYLHPVVIDDEPPTVTGLALALGLRSRQSLLNYKGRAEFKPIIEIAKSRIEAYCEARLYDKDGSNGARFNLECNFGWGREKDKDKGEGATPTVRIVVDIPKPDDGADGGGATQSEDGGDGDNAGSSSS